MIQIPSDGRAQSAFQTVLRTPAQLLTDLGCVDGVASIVSRASRHMRLQRSVARSTAQGWIRGCRHEFIEDVAQAIDKIDVRPFVAAADVVFLSRPPLFQRQEQSRAVILDMEPI